VPRLKGPDRHQDLARRHAGLSTSAPRRRRAALAAAALVAAVLGAVLGAGHDDGGGGGRPAQRRGAAPAARAPGAGRVQPGAVIMLSFDGPRLPAYARRILRRGDAAGVFLRPANVVSPVQLRALTAQIRAAGGADTPVAVDQEGGTVRAVPWAGPAAAPGAAGDPAAVRAAYLAAARALRASGVDVDFAPVADVPHAPGAFIGARAFSGGPPAVAAAVSGLRAGGVAATAKHFPGLGAAPQSTDDAPADLPRPTPADLAPFRAAIVAGAPLVMVSSARYPALDRDRIAAQSPAVVRTLLRARLHFGGAVVTDSLESAAVRHTGSLEHAALAALRAGCDVLLTTGPGSWIRVRRALGAAAARSPALAARLRDAARRVAALRASLG
jgi:beta-N-acetylhexosaminidase